VERILKAGGFCVSSGKNEGVKNSTGCELYRSILSASEFAVMCKITTTYKITK